MALLPDPTPNSTPSTPLPRILCLHGGGTSATIFKIQTRHLARTLAPYFRLIYVDGPFPSDAGPGVLPVFVDCGPYYRWMPPESFEDVEAGVQEQVVAARRTRERVVDAIKRDEEREVEKAGGKGGVGEVVGVLGFSQGARMAAGLLADQAASGDEKGITGMPEWKFGVLLCGSYPPYSIANAGKRPEEFKGAKDEHGVLEPPAEHEVMGDVPTVHVRGLRDPHLEKGRRLGRYFGGEKEEMEFEMGHYLPQAAGDVASGGKNATVEIRDAILRAWRKSQGEEGGVN
ncbi:MAG: hypothetical protein OHK93_006690 [Ramalina farinacea]|uniref:Serine hydrolase domain-containing protein n=1 Tax=Ramalina farinacea TaxID=258253 RepID=A0AA43QJ44_9LECA|nr:hypothetical protein [Ramalina farinacea]